MAENPQPLLPILFLILLHLCHCQSPEPKGFSLKLSITPSSQSTVLFPNTIRPHITRSSYLFTIDATIGTPSRKRTFIFDTGSSLIWTQCKPCIRCFKQDYPLFDPNTSSSYQKLPSNHYLAGFFKLTRTGDYIFNVTYESGQSSSGTAALETFTFPSNRNTNESIKNVVFGCMNNYQGHFSSNTLVTGIMGLNKSPLSLVGQIGPKSVKRFSYCLPTLNSNVKSTFLPRGVFSKGCILDAGSASSILEMVAYTPVLNAVKQHLDRFNLTRIRSDPSTEGDLCYRLKPGFRDYPSMTLHFQGAKFEIGAGNMFRAVNDRFCLAFFGSNRLTLLGAYQQQNVRLVYDVGNSKLLFGKEDCSLDKA